MLGLLLSQRVVMGAGHIWTFKTPVVNLGFLQRVGVDLEFFLPLNSKLSKLEHSNQIQLFRNTNIIL